MPAKKLGRHGRIIEVECRPLRLKRPLQEVHEPAFELASHRGSGNRGKHITKVPRSQWRFPRNLDGFSTLSHAMQPTRDAGKHGARYADSSRPAHHRGHSEKTLPRHSSHRGHWRQRRTTATPRTPGTPLKRLPRLRRGGPSAPVNMDTLSQCGTRNKSKARAGSGKTLEGFQETFWTNVASGRNVAAPTRRHAASGPPGTALHTSGDASKWKLAKRA